jgi:flagellar FliL protein
MVSMDADRDDVTTTEPVAARPPKRGRAKLVIAVVGILLALSVLGAAYATGLVSEVTGAKRLSAAAAAMPSSVDLPDIITNLNAGQHSTVMVRIRASLILPRKADESAIQAAVPRIQDLFQTYLRDLRPAELRGSAGAYRLREELLPRINIAVAPARVDEILFVQLLVQ